MTCKEYIILTIRISNKMKKYVVTVIAVFALSNCFSQLTQTNSNHLVEISGSVSSFYNFRSLNAGEVDKLKNVLNLVMPKLTSKAVLETNWNMV